MKFENGYLIFDTEQLEFKKITGHYFGALNGFDDFNKKGDIALQMLKIIKTDNIDPFYLKRGDTAEYFIYKKYQKQGHQCEWFNDKKAIGFDHFKVGKDTNGYKNMGGIPDIKISTLSAMVEVKGKNIENYDYISKNGVVSEELQGEFYSHLDKMDNYITEWVFFTELQENMIRNKKPITDFTGMKNYSTGIRKTDHEKIEGMIANCRNYLNTIYKERRISIDDISEKNLIILGYDKYNALVDVSQDTPF